MMTGATNGTVVGYARVSTVHQDPSLQVDALEAAGAVRIFTDHATGATTARPQLAAALDYLREGDTLAVWRLDRLGRSLRDLIDQVTALGDRGVNFVSITEGIDTTTPGGRLVFHVFGSIAEFERELIRERTRAGLAAARARGRRGGRPPALTPQQVDAVKAMRASTDMTLDEIAATFKVSRPTIVRALGSPADAEAAQD